ncbi:MAG: SPASM domain-containing protein, partial [Pseudomonadota bacterium]
AADLPALLALMQQEHIDKFYLSHLNYAGRGGKNRRDDASHAFTRNAMETLFDTAWTAVQQGRDWEFVTGNNDADGVFLLHWLARRAPDQVERLTGLLRAWGGNASGRDIANIDTQGHVHPDTFWSTHTLGNVKERPFSVIWQDLSDPLLAGLRTHPRPLEGRCGTCGFRDICNGNTRTRAFQTTGRLWAEDPGCYLTDEEICV